MWTTARIHCPRRSETERLRSTTSSWVSSSQASLAFLIVYSNTIIPVVGQEELDARSVNVRNRDDVGTKAKGEMVSLDKIVEQLVELKKLRSLENKLL